MIDRYVRLLKDNCIKITPQRLEILKYLDEHHTHPTADNIYSALKAKNPSLSKTTVYNSLETLKKHKLIHSLTISASESHYDIRKCMHHHFLCSDCGEIIDIEMACPNVDKIVRGGHHVDEVHGYFKGVCKNCLKKRSTTHG
jgi:Fe2+ or Zn2+ uptake regulation protein